MEPLPDQLHLGVTGRLVSMTEVSKLSPEEKQSLWYERTNDDGSKSRVTPFYDDTAVHAVPDIASSPRMARISLLNLGMTDDALEKERAKLFGPLPKGQIKLSSKLLDTHEVMVQRKAVYDACARSWYAPVAPTK
jgi:hypothetical protein